MNQRIKRRTALTQEEKKVVLPLKKWLERRKTKWIKKNMPNYGTAATGWDLEFERHDLVLLIEAKYFQRSFIGSFSGLVTAPLTHRKQKSIKTKYRSWCAYVCWAIGSSYASRNIYQLLFDYIGRNMDFWRSYGQILKMKYVFFVKEGKVIRLSWSQFLKASEVYVAKVNKLPNHDSKMKLGERREIADKIMQRYGA